MESKTQSEFEKWRSAGSLPAILVLNISHHPVTYGAAPGFDINAVQPDERILMKQLWFTTPKRIHGLLHYDGPNQLLFLGYECSICGEVFLVPDEVTDMYSLGDAMRHGCTASPADRSGYDVDPVAARRHPNTGRSSTGSS